MKSSGNTTVSTDQANFSYILDQFEQMQEGDTLSVCMDYDLQPLYQQLIEKKGENFSWKYQEHGPHWWKVKISKN